MRNAASATHESRGGGRLCFGRSATLAVSYRAKVRQSVSHRVDFSVRFFHSAEVRARLAPTDMAYRLRYWREKAGLSRAEAARKIDVDVSTLSLWEGGKSLPHHPTLVRVIKVYRVDLATFWGPPAPKQAEG